MINKDLELQLSSYFVDNVEHMLKPRVIFNNPFSNGLVAWCDIITLDDPQLGKY